MPTSSPSGGGVPASSIDLIAPGKDLFPRQIRDDLVAIAQREPGLHRLWLARFQSPTATIAMVVEERSDAELSPGLLAHCDRPEYVEAFRSRGIQTGLARYRHEIAPEDRSRIGPALVDRREELPVAQRQVPHRGRLLALVAVLGSVALLLAVAGVSLLVAGADPTVPIMAMVGALLLGIGAMSTLLFLRNAWAVDGHDHVEVSDWLGRVTRIDHEDVIAVAEDGPSRALHVHAADGRHAVLDQRRFSFPRLVEVMRNGGIRGA